MEFDPHALGVLEFPAVLDLLKKRCQWVGGRQALQGMAPLAVLEDVRQRQEEFAQARVMLEQGNHLGLSGLEDVGERVRAAQKGRTLNALDLVDVNGLLRASRNCRQLLLGREDEFHLAAWGEALIPYEGLEQRLTMSIAPDGRLQDSASPRLAEYRADIRLQEGKVQSSFDRFLRDNRYRRMLQEPIVTVRQRRYVLPVKADFKGKFPGLVLDQSQSGATVFMEPYDTVLAQNQLRASQLAEEKEIEAILTRLSSEVGAVAVAILDNSRVLGHLDALFAGARYAVEVEAVLPEIHPGPELCLERAFHPLLGPEAVPISITVGEGHQILVITGPNTGGKTVTLKVVGLMVVMARMGFPIPVGPGSRIPMVGNVFADIGDEQSIAQSLSTFSAHLTQILRILDRARPGTLVLLDELGAGTDPAEGSALGMALMEELRVRGCLTVLTTHLSQLKSFASEHEGFENAAMEFDTSTLMPTYRVLMGVPGRSNALAIAAGLGLPEGVLRRAREHLGREHVEVDNLLEDLETERRVVRQLEARASEESDLATQLRAGYQQKLEKLEAEKTTLLAEAAEEARQMVAKAQSQIHDMLQEFRLRVTAMGKARREALEEARELRKRLQEQLDEEQSPTPNREESFSQSETPEPEPPPSDDVEEEARVQARVLESELESMRDRFEEISRDRPAPVPVDGGRTLEPGDWVYARRYGQEGEVLSVKGKRVEVRLGAVRMTLERGDLEWMERPVAQAAVRVPTSQRQTMSTRVDLRGMTVDEALFELDQRLDAAALARVEKLEVIHGKGTGALRKAVSSHLQRHPQVVDSRLGELHEGGWGVTVVNLRL